MKLRERSGSVNSKDPLVSFFYTLMRDHLTPGVIEGIISDIEEKVLNQEVLYTNGWLANYAKDIVERTKL